MDRNNNNEVELYSCFGAEWQKWSMDDNRIINALNGQCLDIRDGNDDVYVSKCDDSTTQSWTFQDAPPVEHGKLVGKLKYQLSRYKKIF